MDRTINDILNDLQDIYPELSKELLDLLSEYVIQKFIDSWNTSSAKAYYN